MDRLREHEAAHLAEAEPTLPRECYETVARSGDVAWQGQTTNMPGVVVQARRRSAMVRRAS